MLNEGLIVNDTAALVKSEIVRQIRCLGRATPDELEQAVFKALVGHGREFAFVVLDAHEEDRVDFYLPLREGETVVGCGAGCDLALNRDGLSRKHVALSRSGGDVSFRDNGPYSVAVARLRHDGFDYVPFDRGLVDYKIAAIDSTWSGLCFARRAARTSDSAKTAHQGRGK